MATTSYDYTDEFTKQLARKRQLARLLQEQSLQFNLPNPNARGSWLNALGSIAEAYAGKRMGDQADTEGMAHQKEVSDQTNATIKNFLGQYQPHEDMNQQGIDYAAQQQQPPPAAPTTRPSTDTGSPLLPPSQQPQNPMAQLLMGQNGPSMGAQMAQDQGPPLVPQLGDIGQQAAAAPPLIPPDPTRMNFSGTPAQQAALEKMAQADMAKNGLDPNNVVRGPAPPDQQGIPPMPPQGPTPAPSLAGPPPPGALAPPPDQTPPPMMPQPPMQSTAPRTPLMLPAQRSGTPDALAMLDLAGQLPPGQQQAQFMQETLKNVLTEPDRVQTAKDRQETLRQNALLTAAMTGRKIEAGQENVKTKTTSAEAIAEANRSAAAARNEATNRTRIESATISAAARGAASQPSITQEDADRIATQYLAGDKSSVSGLGWGGTGSANRGLVQSSITRLAKEGNMTGPDIAARIAEFGGLQAAERTVGQRGANIEMAAREASLMGDLVVKASEAVPRTDFVPVNQAINYWNTKTGDPAIRQLGAALNSFINVYARAIGGTSASAGTVSDKEHARSMLNDADSHEQIVAIMSQLQKEIETAKAAPRATREALREEASGRAPTKKVIRFDAQGNEIP